MAWVIDVGPHKPAWIARYKDQCTNPTDLREAKVAAMAMAKGADGAYRVRDSVGHLNGLAARLFDAEAATFECMEVTFNLNTIQMASPCTPQTFAEAA